MDNKIREFYENNDSLLATKWNIYIDLYWKHMRKFYEDEKYTSKDKIGMLEIGVRHGGGLLCLSSVFKNSIVYGIDMTNKCKSLEKDFPFKIFIGDQSNSNLLKNVINTTKKDAGLDFVLDDGSHHTRHIYISFRNLFPNMNPGGVYIIEDLDYSSNNDFDEFELVRTSIKDVKSVYRYYKFCVVHKYDENDVRQETPEYFKDMTVTMEPKGYYSGKIEIPDILGGGYTY